MYAAVGALSSKTDAAMQEALPYCYSRQFDFCMDDANMNHPSCRQYMPIHQAFEEDGPYMEKIIDQMPYCNYSRDELLLYSAIAGGGGFLLGLVIAAAMNK